MKTLICALLLVFCSILNYAQPVKGGWLITGAASYNRINYDAGYSLGRVTGHGISLSPKVGIFITNRINVGASIPFNSSRTRYSSNDFPNRNSSLQIGPYIRYYHPLSANLFLLGEADFTIGLQWSRSYAVDPNSGDFVPTKFSTNNSRSTLGIGLAYFVNKNIGIEWLTKCAVYRSTTPDRGFASAIGLQFYLARD